MPKKKPRIFSVQVVLPEDLYEKIHALADKEYMSTAALVRQLIAKRLEAA